MNPDRQIARSRQPVPQALDHLRRRKGSGLIPIRERRQIKIGRFRRLALHRFRLSNNWTDRFDSVANIDPQDRKSIGKEILANIQPGSLSQAVYQLGDA